MTCQQKFIGECVKECGEGWDHENANVLSYALKAAQYVESRERGFIEAYIDGDLRLELYFHSVDYEIDRKFSKDLPIAYGFCGLIGPEHPTASIDKLPGKRSIEYGNREHVVLVSVRELMEVHQWMPGPSLGTYLVRLKPIYGLNGTLTESIETTVLQSRRERIRIDTDRVKILKRGFAAVIPHQCVDDVVQGGSEVVDYISRDHGEFERRVSHYLKSEPSASAVVCIGLGHNRHVRSIVQVRQNCSAEPMHVEVGISEFMNHAF